MRADDVQRRHAIGHRAIYTFGLCIFVIKPQELRIRKGHRYRSRRIHWPDHRNLQVLGPQVIDGNALNVIGAHGRCECVPTRRRLRLETILVGG